MENKYKLHCPDAQDFKTYLNKTGDSLFNRAFELHAKQCPLCNEALEGYQITGIKTTGRYKKPQPNFANPYGKTKRIYRQLGYAATILLVLGMVSYSLWFPANRTYIYTEDPVYEFNGNELNKQSGEKKISKKQNLNQYWYIGTNDKLAVNDYFINPDKLKEALMNSASAKSILVQVENTDNRFNQKIITQLKENQNAPVYSYSSSRDIKKLTSWEGM